MDADKQYVMERAQLTVGAADELVITTVESNESRQIKKFLYETGMPALTSIEIAEEWEEIAVNDSDKVAWDALSKIVAPSSIQEQDGHVAIDLDYRIYIDYFPVLRKAWLKKGQTIDFYRKIALIVLPIFARKAATAITQGFFGSGKARDNNVFSMYVDAFDGEIKERFLLLSWKVTKKLVRSVNWRTLNDARFPKTVLDYAFSEEYITMLEGPLKLLGWRPPAED